MIAAKGESIKAKFKRLSEAVRRLEILRIENTSEQQFLDDFKAQDSAIYNIVVAIEAITDIGGHILAEYFQEYSDTYRDVLLNLGKHKVVPIDFAERTSEMARFRNLAIHVYEGLSIEEVYKILQHASDDIVVYARALADFL